MVDVSPSLNLRPYSIKFQIDEVVELESCVRVVVLVQGLGYAFRFCSSGRVV